MDATAAWILAHWRYDPDTGQVLGRGGKPVGTLRRDGALHANVYPVTGVTSVLLHRAAYLLKTRAWPPQDIDHRNGVRSDNRWANIRPATKAGNRQNLAGRSAKGQLRGVTQYYRKWKAQIKAPGEKTPRYLGLFDTEVAAHEAYCKAKLELHTFNPEQRR